MLTTKEPSHVIILLLLGKVRKDVDIDGGIGGDEWKGLGDDEYEGAGIGGDKWEETGDEWEGMDIGEGMGNNIDDDGWEVIDMGFDNDEREGIGMLTLTEGI